MSKLLRSKSVIGVVCIALAAVTAFLILPRFYASQSATETVVRVVRDVPAGSVLTKAMVTSAEVGAYGLGEGILREESAAVGQVAGENLYAGEYLMAERVVTPEEYRKQEDAQTKGLTNGQTLVTIAFPSASAGVAGVLRAGDLVDVYEYAEEENEEGERIKDTRLVYRSMTVYDVLNRNLVSLDELDERKAAAPEGDNTNWDFVPAYVVFRCTQSQVRTLIRLERTDALHLALAKAVT